MGMGGRMNRENVYMAVSLLVVMAVFGYSAYYKIANSGIRHFHREYVWESTYDPELNETVFLFNANERCRLDGDYSELQGKMVSLTAILTDRDYRIFDISSLKVW
jgi:hypothetical protein